MTGMETETVIAYRGQATLIPKSDDREYPCYVRIRVMHDIRPLWDVYLGDTHRWDADITGDLLAPTPERPPYGEATLRLPGGSTGEAMFQAIAPVTDSMTWDGALTGLGRSPTE